MKKVQYNTSNHIHNYTIDNSLVIVMYI